MIGRDAGGRHTITGRRGDVVLTTFPLEMTVGAGKTDWFVRFSLLDESTEQGVVISLGTEELDALAAEILRLREERGI
jgi:hypothetical protein